MEITIKEVEVQRLNLQKDEVLVVKYKGDQVEVSQLMDFRTELRKIFPNNKVVILGLPENEDMEFSTIKPE
jgi:hypothetical protein